jgi:acetyltransferase-like isoleucine patch superfamily enzyme
VTNIFFNPADLKRCGRNVIIGKTVRIRHPELVEIGDDVIIDDFTYISGEVSIGNYVHVAANCTVSASKSKVTFEPFSGISSGVRIYAGSSNYLMAGLDLPTIPEKFAFGAIYEEVVLGRFALIGANSVVLPGCNLPEGLAAAACIILKKRQYEPWTVVLDSDGNTVQRRGREKVLAAAHELMK